MTAQPPPDIEIVAVKSQIRLKWRTRFRIWRHRRRLGEHGRALADALAVQEDRAFLFGEQRE